MIYQSKTIQRICFQCKKVNNTDTYICPSCNGTSNIPIGHKPIDTKKFKLCKSCKKLNQANRETCSFCGKAPLYKITPPKVTSDMLIYQEGINALKRNNYTDAFQMAKQVGTDSELRHVTVLEEAHNLLKKTSAEQGQETANLQGKSVEMLTNAIAEMRTYGEGFIIADQAPDLLDTAVIRNTNTKIVLRLPEGKDREITGTAMALNENQTQELSKLPTGVAAVYQNNWQEAVLCNIPRYKSFDLPADTTPTTVFVSEQEILKKLLSSHAAAECLCQ